MAAIAKLPSELVRELERAGGRPLTVEHPQTKRVYVLVDVEQFDVVPRTASDSADAWTEIKNERRCALIRKKFAEGIDSAEAAELTELQAEVSAARQRAASLPYDVIDALGAALNSRDSSSLSIP